MAEVEAVTRRWGNSLGVIIPKEVVDEERLQENQHVILDLHRVTDVRRLRGLVKFKKTAQQLKDEMRAGRE
ncbi:AbrB/MazE/SpoVT family DNA-binding domain-containing protein [Candidatus Woesearchaeota archaeon]|nr:AbrB/MazE/SpoVT family DNA-binding domain-containing protein [Candidatus Woesearchaeota archaeon]